MTARPPRAAPASPEAAQRALRSGRRWIAAVVVAAVALCGTLLSGNHLQAVHRRATIALLRQLQQVSDDAQQGVLHLELGGVPGSSWQVAHGVALLRQAQDEVRALGSGAADDADAPAGPAAPDAQARQALVDELAQVIRTADRAGTSDPKAALAWRLLLGNLQEHLFQLAQDAVNRNEVEGRRLSALSDVSVGLAATLFAFVVAGMVRVERARGRALHALGQSAQRERGTLEALAEGVLVFDAEGRVTDANAAAEALLGAPADTLRAEAPGLPSWSLHEADGAPLPADRWPHARVLASGRPLHDETLALRAPGREERLVSVHAVPLAGPGDARAAGAVMSFTDVTETRRQALRLAEHRDHLEELVRDRTRELQANVEAKLAAESFAQIITDAQPTLLAYWDDTLTLRFANRAYLAWLGRRREDAVDRTMTELFGAAFCQRHEPAIRRVLDGQPDEEELELPGHEGRTGHFWIHRLPDNRRGRIAGYFFIATDVSEVHEAKRRLEGANAALREAEALVRAVADHIPGRLSYWDRSRRLLFANHRFHAQAGRPAESLVGQRANDARLPARLHLQEPQATLAYGGELQVFDLEETAPDGRTVVKHHTYVPHLQEGDGGGAGDVTGLLVLSSDVTELITARREAERLAQALARSEEFLRQVADTIPGMIGYWDRDERCDFANSAYLEWFGRRPDQIIGRRIVDLLGPDLYQRNLPYIRQALAGRRQDFERTLHRPDGRVGHTLTSYVPHLVRGEVRGFIVVVTDVTPLKAAEERLALANATLEQRAAQAESATRAKSAFLANMSHEIRTPMNAIIGLTHLIARDVADPVQLGRLGKVDGAARHLLQVINDILDLSKIEAGKVTLEAVAFARDELVRRAMDVVSEEAAAKGLELVVDTDHLPERLVGDPKHLAQALINLLGNAVKFTAHGWVRLRAELMDEDDTSLRARFSVTDSGIGIAADSVPRLFQAFEQADASTTRRFGGTGLGLALTRHIAQLMDGEVGVDSRPGVGSTFWFTARLGRAAAAPASAPAATADLPSLAGLRALVVDDLNESLQAIGDGLAVLGLHTELAHDGPEGIARFAHARENGVPHDVLLLDWRMPGMSGTETLALMRTLGGRMPPCLLVSAYDGDDMRSEAREAAFDAVLVKPVTVESLRDTLLRALAGRVPRRLPADTAAAARLAEGDADAVPDIRRAAQGRRLLLAEDNPINQEVACELLASVGFQVDVASDGEEALRRLRERAYDLVLMDVQMPRLDGLAATRALREEFGHGMPVVAMTANAFGEDRADCLAAGMNDHIAKPVEPAHLYTVLARWLPARPDAGDGTGTGTDTGIGAGIDDGTATPAPPAAAAAAPAVPPSLDLALSAIDGIDLGAALRGTSGDLALLVRLLRMFVHHYGDGDPGLAAADSPQALRLACHAARSAMAAVGALDLAQSLRHLEQQAGAAGAEFPALRDRADALQADLRRLAAAVDRVLQSRATAPAA